MLDEFPAGGRFLLKDVEARAAQDAFLEAMQQRVLVHHPAAGHVQHTQPGLHALEAGPTEEVLGVRVQRHVEGQVVDLTEEVIVGQEGHAGGLGRFGGEHRIVHQHLHRQAAGALGHRASDASKADDTQGLAGELGAGVEIPVPAAPPGGSAPPVACGGPGRT